MVFKENKNSIDSKKYFAILITPVTMFGQTLAIYRGVTTLYECLNP